MRAERLWIVNAINLGSSQLSIFLLKSDANLFNSAASITDCPARMGSTTSEIVPISTSLIPVVLTKESEATSSAIEIVVPASTAYSTSILYATSVSSSTSPSGVTEIVSEATNIVPISTSLVTAIESGGSVATSTAAGVVVSSGTSYSISIVDTTSIYTIRSCAASVTNCPARMGSTTSEFLPVSTALVPFVLSGGSNIASTAALAGSGSDSFYATSSAIELPSRAEVHTPQSLLHLRPLLFILPPFEGLHLRDQQEPKFSLLLLIPLHFIRKYLASHPLHSNQFSNYFQDNLPCHRYSNRCRGYDNHVNSSWKPCRRERFKLKRTGLRK